MPPEPEPEVADLLGAMLNLKLYVIVSRGKGLDIRPRLREHLEYMIELERRGVLFASGPLGLPGTGDGMTIVRTENEADARAIAERDPFVRHGLREFGIESWTLMEGSLRLAINLSDGSAGLS